MKIKMTSTAAGPKGTFVAGLEYEVADEVGTGLIDAHAAEEIAAATEEKAVEEKEEAVDQEAESRETATGKGQRKGRRPKRT